VKISQPIFLNLSRNKASTSNNEIAGNPDPVIKNMKISGFLYTFET